MENPVRILIVDSHGVFREALAYRLSAEPDLKVVAHHGTVAEAIHALSAEAVDVVLLDFELRDGQGSDLITWAANRALRLRFLVLTARLASDDAAWLIRHHVAGICLTEVPLSELLAAIRAVACGGKWLDQPFLKLVLDDVSGTAPVAPAPLVLTEREQAALRLLIDGCTNKEIGTHLKITETAAKAVVQKLFDKTSVRSRAQLVRVAIQKYQDCF